MSLIEPRGTLPMFYQLYELNHAMMAPWRTAADAMRLAFSQSDEPDLAHLFRPRDRGWPRGLRAVDAPLRQAGIRPSRNADRWQARCRSTSASSGASRSAISSISSARFPRGGAADPKVLIVAPMSGHYATLLRGTVEALLPHSDIYITDWIDARMVPLERGHLRSRRLHRLRHPDAAFPRARHPCDRRLSARRSGACRRRADGSG